MTKRLSFWLIGSALGGAFLLAQNQFTYVGASKCAMCHRSETRGQQSLIWEKSYHAQSFATLSSPEGKSVAQSVGVAKPEESPACLKCHAPLYEQAPDLKAEGITCEVCHGPGSEYRQLEVMRDRELAAKKGLIIYSDMEAIKKQCEGCHATAHGLSFNFSEAWEKIKHPVPRK